MNIRLVVRRGVVYLLAVTIAGLVFLSAVGAAAALASADLQDVPLALQVALSLAIALAFTPLKTQIQKALDRYLYRESYDYQRIVKDTTRTLTSTLDFASLLQYLSDVINRTLRPDFVAVFTRDVGGHAFSLAAKTSAAQVGIQEQASRVASDTPLPLFLTTRRQPLLRDELGRTVHGDAAAAAVKQLISLGGDFVLPILSDRNFIGFLLIGKKLSGDAYFAEDVDLVSTLAQQAAIALENAQLYREVILGNEYIQNILATMDSGVITVDAAGNVALCNSTAEELLGLPKTRLTSLDVGQLPESLAIHLRSTLADGRPRLQVETTLPSDDLRLLPIVCSTSALTDNRGHILGALVVFSDLSKIKALESEKRRAERLAAFSTLVSGIAHEIKNPLVAIKTFAELLPERFADTDFREDFAKVVVTEIDRIDDLVARLRGLAVPSAHSAGPTDIREPIDETIALLRAKCEQTNTAVVRFFEDREPYVAVDSSQLKQLVLNLLINAIEATGSGGRIMVRVTRRAAEEGSRIVTEVSDNGPGIPDSIRSNIFNPFFTTKSRGSGLGLAICRGITDAHRGTIRAASNAVGAGTTMVVEFPAASVPATRAEEKLVRA
jgi:signal transduction histidine kinase